MNPLVSIIIPAHNAQRWIGQTIASALAQTWPRCEVIVVDDGSRDGTLEVARKHASRSLKVVSQENQGASSARNAGLLHAQGDCIQWLDADDLLARDKIEHQVRRLRHLPPSTLLTSAFGEFLVHPQRARFRPSALWQNATPLEHLLCKFTGNLWLTPATWLIPRALTEHAGPWDERLTLDDDGEYFTRLVSHASKVEFVGESNMYYRRAGGTLSRATSQRAFESLLLSLTLCIGHLRRLEDSDRTRSAGVRLLQHWVDRSDCFWPEDSGRFRRAADLAASLGGTLQPPSIGWKYAPLQAVFGAAAARRCRAAWSETKLRARIQIDGLIPAGRNL